MSRSTMLMSGFVAVVVAAAMVMEGALAAQQQVDQNEELSNLKLLVPLLRVDEEDEVPETEAWRVNSDSSSSEEDSAPVNAVLSKLQSKLASKPSQASAYRPRVYNLGVHNHADHAGKPCPICLLLKSLKAFEESDEVRYDNNQKRGSGNRQQRAKQRGSQQGSERGSQHGNERGSQQGSERGSQQGNQLNSLLSNLLGGYLGSQLGSQRGDQRGDQRGNQRQQQKVQRDGPRESQAEQACAVSVIELDEGRRTNEPHYVDSVEATPKVKAPVP